MKQIIEGATQKAVIELKAMVRASREALIEALTNKVGKLSHSEERQLLGLILTPGGESKTTYVEKRVKLLIAQLLDDASVKVDKPAKKRGRPAKVEEQTEGES